ncbi:hypothetical protein MASR1M74_10210 [Lentimicrobium sp.]
MMTFKSFNRLIFTIILCAGLFSGCGKDEQNTKNHVPAARFTVDASRGDVNTIFNFDASAVTDEEDATSVLEVRWDWENDGIYDTEFTAVKTASHRYTTPGLYFPLLQVRDTRFMTDSTTKMLNVVIDIGNRPPTLPLYITPPDYQTYMEPEVIFKWTCTDPEDDELVFDLWVGRSRATLSPIQTGISDYTIVDGKKVYQTQHTFTKFSHQYHWRIFARDTAGNYTAGHIWRFTTRPE